MSRLLRALIALPVTALICLTANSISANTNRLALVIGNSAYPNAPLKNPANDATDISRALKRLNFKVTMLRDTSQRSMEESIRKFGKRLMEGGVGLFYYAGHGMQVDGRNYLIPVDARIEDPSDVKYEALDAGRVLGKMEVAGNDMNIVILDACRDNPFSRGWRSTQKGLARMEAPKGSYIAYATAPGSVAADGSGRNGTFTKSLLRHIEVPGLTLESVMKRVRKDVIQETGSKQIPWDSSSITGEFYFDPSRSISIVSKDPLVVKTLKKDHAKISPVRKAGSTEFETRELRYAKKLLDRGKKSEAKRIVSGLLKSDDDTVLSEAMYCQLIWGFASNDRDALDKLNAYYPDFKWLSIAEKKIVEREKVRKIEDEKKRKAEAKRKKLEAERKRLEEKQKKLQSVEKKKLASLSPSVSKPSIVARDGWYIKYENGVVYDKNTGLEWYTGPDRDMTWDKAKSWADNLNVAGGGWRLPEIYELRDLYHDLTSLLKINGWKIWKGNKHSSLHHGLEFKRGQTLTTGSNYSDGFRGVAVRPQKYDKLKPASISQLMNQAKIITSDKYYSKYDNGVVYDKNTGLEWYVGPDIDMTWKEARVWVLNLDVAGGGWKTPTLEELIGLYRKGDGNRNMTPLLKTTGWWVWSVRVSFNYTQARYLSFATGKKKVVSIPTDSHDGRAFAVRSRR